MAVAVGKKNMNDHDKRPDEPEKSICHGQIEVSLSKERTYDSQVMLSLVSFLIQVINCFFAFVLDIALRQLCFCHWTYVPEQISHCSL